ncbi:MAG TPA: hypothetical protein VMU89_02870 [Thermomicrobiaceae bacterium]|nr:hypothetical protein [Thermomicrobiaceae bacterium]
MGRVLAFPFVLVWDVVRLILNLVGRTVGVMLGFLLAVVGIALSLTGIGAIIGVPLVMLGAALMLKGLFGR